MTVISAAHIAGTGKSASTNRSAWAPNLLAARLRASHGGQDHRRNRRRLRSKGKAAAFAARMGSTSARWLARSSHSLHPAHRWPISAHMAAQHSEGRCRWRGRYLLSRSGPPTSRSRRFRDRTGDLPLFSYVVPGDAATRENRLWSLAEVDHSWRSEGLLQFGEPIVVLRIVATITRVRLYFHPIAVPAGERSL